MKKLKRKNNNRQKKKETPNETEIGSTDKMEQMQNKIEEIQDEEVQNEFAQIKQKMQELNDNPKVVSEDFNEMYAKLFGRAPIEEKKEENIAEKRMNAVDLMKDNVSVFESIPEYQKPNYKFIGIVFQTYIILEIENEMYILDQHAAHERIMYEKVKKNYYSETSKDYNLIIDNNLESNEEGDEILYLTFTDLNGELINSENGLRVNTPGEEDIYYGEAIYNEVSYQYFIIVNNDVQNITFIFNNDIETLTTNFTLTSYYKYY